MMIKAFIEWQNLKELVIWDYFDNGDPSLNDSINSIDYFIELIEFSIVTIKSIEFPAKYILYPQIASMKLNSKGTL